MQIVITCFFNPNNCQIRLNNYKIFHEYIKRTNTELYTIEIVFENKNFELNSNDANYIKQIKSKDIMFQKERMLNIALESLDEKYKEIIWMDCDLFYFENDWTERVSEGLKNHIVIQPYSQAIALPKSTFFHYDSYQTNFDNCFGSGTIKRSYAYYKSKKNSFNNFHHGHAGYVWAARREFLDRHKFYDPIITGAGDLFMLMAFTGQFGWLDYPDQLKGYDMEAAVHFFDWGFPVYKEIKGQIGYTNDVVYHIWHGEIYKRNYLDFCKILQINKFNPNKDIKINSDGCWEWSSDKEILHNQIKDIFKP